MSATGPGAVQNGGKVLPRSGRKAITQIRRGVRLLAMLAEQPVSETLRAVISERKGFWSAQDWLGRTCHP